MAREINEPSLPYLGTIRIEDFYPGKTIRVQGLIPRLSQKFTISLRCGSSPNDDVALQVAIHMIEESLTINAMKNGVWGEERRIVPLPDNSGERFEILLKCELSSYKILINGHCYEFPQKTHYSAIKYLSMDGDASVTKVSFESIRSPALNRTAQGRLGSPRTPVPPVTHNFGEIDAPPPSYESVMAGSLGTPVGATTVPYPTGGAPYPIAGPPYPVGDPPYPTGGGGIPMPDPPYPTGLPTHPQPLAGYLDAAEEPGFTVLSPLHSLPSDAPIPLNAASSNFRRVSSKKFNGKMVAAVAIILLLVAIIVIWYVKTKIRKPGH